MRSSTMVALATVVAVLAGATDLAATAPAIVSTTKIVERRDPTCPAHADAYSCAHIRFTYPVIERAPKRGAAAAINRAVADFLLTSIGEPRKSESIEAAMTSFMDGYQQYKQIGGTDRAHWDERTVTIPYQSDRIVSLNFVLSFALGGLHPQYASTFTSFNAARGAKIRLGDVLVPGYEARLTRIGENTFRRVTHIKPGVTLHDAGYIFFKNDAFALNENFWIGAKGITFYYNPYEIAPYAMGTTELLLTYREIRELIRPDGLLGTMK